MIQAQWQQPMGNNPSYFRSPKRPVERVSWYDAFAYTNARSRAEGLPDCYELSDEEGRPGEEGYRVGTVRFRGLDYPGYRLPTEAEWEYAARAGTRTAVWTEGI